MAEAPDDASRWSWVTRYGTVASGAKGELMLALRSEKIPPSTWVWRPTWAEWLPASRVTELRGVLPAELGEAPQAPRRSATQLAPPPIPEPGAPPPARPPAAAGHSHPPPAPVRGASGTSRPPTAARSQPPPAPARHPQELARPNLTSPRVPSAAGPVATTAGVEAPPRGVSILGPPRNEMMNTQPRRSPLPTLGGEEGALGRATLRPPGAVPPPPRSAMGPSLGVAPPRLDEEQPTQRKLAAPSAHADTEHDVPAPTELRPALVVPVFADGARPPASLAPVGASAAPFPASHDFDVTLGSTPFESEKAREAPAPSTTLESALPLPPEKVSEPAPTLQQWLSLDIPRDAQLTLAFFLIVVILGAVVMLAFVVARTKPPTGAAGEAAVPSVSASEAAPSEPPGCRLLSPAARLATTVERAVQPAFAELARGERLAVGFAPTPKSAAGLLVRLDNLDTERPFDQTGDAATRATVPVVKAGKTTFYVDHANSELSGARTLAEGVTLGFAGPDLVRVNGGQTTLLWSGAAAEKATDPRVASASGGTLVTFRRGGLTGQVLYGWLGKDGGAAGLLAIEAPAVKFSGTPDAAASGENGLVAFAGRPSEKADWRIQLAKVPQKGRANARTFETPAGGPGGGNIAPALTALGPHGWLLQWTEGASGQYQVRMARLGPDLELLAEPRLVSPKGANAGQGSVFASGSRVLSVFVQTTAGHDELWGASFECF